MDEISAAMEEHMLRRAENGLISPYDATWVAMQIAKPYFRQAQALTPEQREGLINEMQEAHSAAYANALVRSTVYYTAMEAALAVAEKRLVGR
jgi:hypothetical protein